MYTIEKNILLLVSLLKQYGIKHIVVSPGSEHIPLIKSLQLDNYFKCYSIVDERSAAFFALGLTEQYEEPVAMCCTSGTAICNYLSAVTEAYYRNRPLLVLTPARHPIYSKQQQEQEIIQDKMFVEVTRKVVNVPIVNTEDDYYYSVRLMNDALSELRRQNGGPVHINYGVIGKFVFNVKELPNVTKIERILPNDNLWKEVYDKLRSDKRILVLYGNNSISGVDKKGVDEFFSKTNSMIAISKESNLTGDGCLNIYGITKALSAEQIVTQLLPDIVITLYENNFTYIIKKILKKHSLKFEHWHVSETGEMKTHFYNLKYVFEMTPNNFLLQCVKELRHNSVNHDYYNKWEVIVDGFQIPQLPFSEFSIIKQFMEKLPSDCILHVGNGQMARYIQFFQSNSNIRIIRNSGTTGIDGTVSTYVGCAWQNSKTNYLLIGDLSFMYDSNGLWNSYSKNKLRIIINNNHCGETMYHYDFDMKNNDVDFYACTSNSYDVKGWAENLGIQYLTAKSQEEYDDLLPVFLDDKIEKSIIFEVMTDVNINMETWNQIFDLNKNICPSVFPYRSGMKYIIYGTSSYAKKVTEQIKECGGVVVGYSDSNKSKWGTKFEYLPVLPPVKLLECEDDYDQIVIGSTYKKEIMGILKAIGVADDKIYMEE